MQSRKESNRFPQKIYLGTCMFLKKITKVSDPEALCIVGRVGERLHSKEQPDS